MSTAPVRATTNEDEMVISKINPTAEQIKDAKKMGVESFKAGRGVAPAHSQTFLKWAISTGSRLTTLMGAYTTGWTIASLAEGQTSDFPSVKSLAEILA